MAETLEQRITRHEGLRLKPYVDTVGKITIGVGHNLTDNGLPAAMVDELFQGDLQIAKDALHHAFPWTDTLTPLRYEVFVELVFNLGTPKLALFDTFLSLAQADDWPGASADLLTTKWAAQVKSRAVELAHLLL